MTINVWAFCHREDQAIRQAQELRSEHPGEASRFEIIPVSELTSSRDRLKAAQGGSRFAIVIDVPSRAMTQDERRLARMFSGQRVPRP